MRARYCQNCKSFLTGDGDTCSAFCRDRLALRRTADRQRAMSSSELMTALGGDGLRVDYFFGTDIPREIQSGDGMHDEPLDPLPRWYKIALGAVLVLMVVWIIWMLLAGR